jgi:hypothetical protein
MFFTIDADNNITTYDAQPAAAEGDISFASQKEFTAATKDWPSARFVAVWNTLAGTPGPFAKLKEVKKFMDRQTAINRIWNVIHILSGDPAKDMEALQALAAAKKAARDGSEAAAATKVQPEKPGAPKAKKGGTEAKQKKPAKPAADKPAQKPAEGSKKDAVIAMMRRKGGATLCEIMDATGWQSHTVRGFVAGALKKMGLVAESTKNEAGERTYSL